LGCTCSDWKGFCIFCESKIVCSLFALESNTDCLCFVLFSICTVFFFCFECDFFFFETLRRLRVVMFLLLIPIRQSTPYKVSTLTCCSKYEIENKIKQL
jgi:hypothetical protein